MDLFGTAGIRGDVRDRVTPALALTVGRAVGGQAADSGETVVVGRDGRTTGPALESAVAAGALSAGATVERVGVVPTPALAFASRERRGVMLTASHNPPTDNGVKLFVDGTEYDRSLECAVEDAVHDDPRPAAWNEWRDTRERDVVSDYCDAVVAFAAAHGSPLDGLRVVVDCGNGVASLATPQVLRRLGAHVVTLNANVDGHFPGRPSKPTPETLADLREFLAEGGYDLGIGHDGDADRIVVVDGAGDVVHEDTGLAGGSEHYVRTSAVDDPVVVTTPNASARIDERVRAAGGRVERVRLGALHEGIANVDAGGGDVVFAAEPWKHVHPGFGLWIDGVLSAAIVSRLVAAEGLASLCERVTERPYRKENVACPDAKKPATMARLSETLPAAFPEAAVDTDYGVRLELPDGSWVLVRPSGTEPYVRVYAESDDVESLVSETRTLVSDAVETAS